jgi:hypothetical protein
MDTDTAPRASGNDPGWKWIPEQRIYLWWDGQRYTTRAEWDGEAWVPAPTITDGSEISPVVPGAVDKSSSALASFWLAVSAWVTLCLLSGGLALWYSGNGAGVVVADGVLRPAYFVPIVLGGLLSIGAFVAALDALGVFNPNTAPLSRRKRLLAIWALVLVSIVPLLALVMVGGSGDV